MSRRRGTASLVASPVLVGAVTVLISIIAVFIAYNANQGLPFVPTYDLKAELPSGAKLVKGNEVRVGGFRVGVVDAIRPKTVTQEGDRRSIAVVDLKLDKVVEPLRSDSKLEVRPRSALGLKYLQVVPGKKGSTFAAGDTVPLANASEPLELEDVLDTFDRDTRPNVQLATEGFGNAFAGRGQSLNTAIEALNPFFGRLRAVAANLADPDTELDQFFRQLGRASAQVAPVARTQAVLFTNMADTFAAISSDPRALQLTIERSPPTLDTAIRSFRVQRPFLADFADLSRRLRPAVRQLPVSLPALNRAFRVGIPVLPRTAVFNRRLTRASRELERLFEDPNTLLVARDLRSAFRVTRPAVEFVAPYQLVCNYTNYFLLSLGEHFSVRANNPETGGGTVQNQGVKLANIFQPNNFGTIESSRRADTPPNPPGGDPRRARNNFGPLERHHENFYAPAIDAQGNADCEIGQYGAPRGPYNPYGRYPPGELPDGTPTGGNAPIVIPDYPILSGGTYKSRQLGITNLRDVP